MNDTGDRVVHCRDVEAGDVIRTPSPGAKFVRVLRVDRAARRIEVDRSDARRAGKEPIFTWGKGYVWVVRRAAVTA